MKKLFYLIFVIGFTIGMLGIPYSYASEKPIDLMNEVVTNGACTSLEEDIGTGLIASPILLTDCSLFMLWPGMINQILLDNGYIEEKIFFKN
jgi:hypothetical protein